MEALTPVIVISVLILLFFHSEILAFIHNRIIENTRISRKDYVMVHTFLHKRMEYYRNLSPIGRARFINRIHRFLMTKDFVGKEGLVVTEEMKVLIAGSAVQLTYGLDKYILNHYHTIMVFPRIFYSRLLNQKLKGATSTRGTMAFSWEDFLEGYANEHDGINLGLHEMAHALKFDVTHGDFKFDHHFKAYADNWSTQVYPVFKALRSGSLDFLRKYGGTNMDEFFSVCVEHFFEVPEQFKTRLPHMYRHLVKMLKQDPCNKSMDYYMPRSRAA